MKSYIILGTSCRGDTLHISVYTIVCWKVILGLQKNWIGKGVQSRGKRYYVPARLSYNSTVNPRRAMKIACIAPTWEKTHRKKAWGTTGKLGSIIQLWRNLPSPPLAISLDHLDSCDHLWIEYFGTLWFVLLKIGYMLWVWLGEDRGDCAFHWP